MLRFYTGCFGTWWMLSRACGEQPGTQPQGFAPSVLPCKGNPSFGICLLFLLRNNAKTGMEEFSHGVKIFGGKGQKYHCWSIEMFPSQPLSPPGFLLAGPFLSPHSLVLSPNNFDNVDLLYQIKF